MTKNITKTTRLLPASGNEIPTPPERGEIPLAPVYFKPNRHLPLLKMLSREGMRMADMAEQCGITTRELGIWRSRYQVIDDAITEGHRGAQAIIENALFESAMGLGTVVETVHIQGSDNKGGKYEEDRIIVKQRAPDPRAQMFILKNIAPDRWKEKQEIKSDHDLNIVWNEVIQELPEKTKEKLKELPEA